VTTDPYDELDDFLAGPEPDWDSEPEPPPDANRAEAMLIRLRRLRAERQRSRDAAETRIRQAVEWQAERESVYLKQEEWLQAALARWHAAVLSLDPNRKTIILPSGELTSRMGQPHWNIDGDKVLEVVCPEPVRDALERARLTYILNVSDILQGNLGSLAPCVRVSTPSDPELSVSGLKKVATERDAKGNPVRHGVIGDEPIPGVTVDPAERVYDVRLHAEHDQEAPPDDDD
jgi:hypothetical protein